MELSLMDVPERPCVSGPAMRAYAEAFSILVWLEQRDFPYASVELFNDGTGSFCIPLQHEPPDDTNEVLRALEQRIGRCPNPGCEHEARAVLAPYEEEEGPAMAWVAFCHQLRR